MAAWVQQFTDVHSMIRLSALLTAQEQPVMAASLQAVTTLC
ncbi:hypothetical protein HaLaN_23591, partial [Haematococcus lacustris]